MNYISANILIAKSCCCYWYIASFNRHFIAIVFKRCDVLEIRSDQVLDDRNNRELNMTNPWGAVLQTHLARGPAVNKCSRNVLFSFSS